MHGPATLTISLPTAWIKKHNVKKGAELEVLEEEGHLKILTTTCTTPKKSIELDLSDLNIDAVNIILAVLHKAGYDEIHIINCDCTMIEAIQSRIQEMLIGYELIEQKSSSCLIKSISVSETQEFENVMRRTFLVTLELAEGVQKELQKTKHIQFDNLFSLEHTNNRLTNFCERIINKSTTWSHKKTFTYIIIWILESICDDYKIMLKYIKNNTNKKISDETLVLLEDTNALLREFYHIFYTYSDKAMESLRMKQGELAKKLITRMNQLTDEETPLLIYLHSITQRIHDATASTCGIHH